MSKLLKSVLKVGIGAGLFMAGWYAHEFFESDADYDYDSWAEDEDDFDEDFDDCCSCGSDCRKGSDECACCGCESVEDSSECGANCGAANDLGDDDQEVDEES